MEDQTLRWDIETFELKLKYEWKISRNTSLSKQNVVIFLNNQPSGEGAPNVRWGQSVEKIWVEFEKLQPILPKKAHELSAFREDLSKMNISSPLKCALDMTCCNSKPTVNHSCETSYSLPILDPNEYKTFIDLNNLNRFNVLKIKLDTVQIKERLMAVKNVFSGNIFVDFNEAFENFSDISPFIKTLNELEVKLIEQPFRAGKFDDNLKIKQELTGKLFLDEDITDQNINQQLAACCDGVNIKIQKTGGPKRAAQLLSQARDHNLQTMVGCMVETSLGISHSMSLPNVDYYDLDGSLMIEKEPFGFVSEKNGLLKVEKLATEK